MSVLVSQVILLTVHQSGILLAFVWLGRLLGLVLAALLVLVVPSAYQLEQPYRHSHRKMTSTRFEWLVPSFHLGTSFVLQVQRTWVDPGRMRSQVLRYSMRVSTSGGNYR